jgi:hypothetical protein
LYLRQLIIRYQQAFIGNYQMGNISFLTGGNSNSPHSLEESIYQLENTSVIFLDAWQRIPPDTHRAARVSAEAMVLLDHIVNEILRGRDQLKASKSYSGSPLETQLNIDRGLMVMPVTRAQQSALVAQGPGNGMLPNPGSPLSMERLLNKIKHRRKDIANFRVGPSGEHIFVIAVDAPNQKPESLVEFVVNEFCHHCSLISAIM